jgi:Domain of unknown function (DUF397)
MTSNDNWRKSSYSGGEGGNCVEVAATGEVLRVRALNPGSCCRRGDGSACGVNTTETPETDHGRYAAQSRW